MVLFRFQVLVLCCLVEEKMWGSERKLVLNLLDISLSLFAMKWKEIMFVMKVFYFPKKESE